MQAIDALIHIKPQEESHCISVVQVNLLAKHIGKSNDDIERVIARPTYFNPYEAVEFGIIDKVIDMMTLIAGHALLYIQ